MTRVRTSRIHRTLALVLVTGLAACDAADIAAPPAPDALVRADATSADTPTASSSSWGALIAHDEVIYGFSHFDADRNLMSVHGWIVEFCQGQPLSTTPRTIVTTPSEVAQRLVKIGEAEQPVIIYRTEIGALTCALVTSPDVRVASGMVRHDQVFTLASFKATWRGRVTAPDGSTHPYTEVYQLTADIHDPNNPDLWSLNTSKILVHR